MGQTFPCACQLPSNTPALTSCKPSSVFSHAYAGSLIRSDEEEEAILVEYLAWCRRERERRAERKSRKFLSMLGSCLVIIGVYLRPRLRLGRHALAHNLQICSVRRATSILPRGGQTASLQLVVIGCCGSVSRVCVNSHAAEEELTE